jgi:hypothetical protein
METEMLRANNAVGAKPPGLRSLLKRSAVVSLPGGYFGSGATVTLIPG